MNDKRQKNQLQMALAFTGEGRSEAPRAPREGTESFTAKCETESPARAEQLMEEVCGRENCQRALRRVKANKGSPGIDGMKVSELTGYLKQHWPALREQLLSGTYQPQPVRRVEIKKPDGGMRKLGIPTVLDRMIQQAVMQVLQRRWDPTFSEHSHGFRPQRSAHQAVAKAQQAGVDVLTHVPLDQALDEADAARMAADARIVPVGDEQRTIRGGADVDGPEPVVLLRAVENIGDRRRDYRTRWCGCCRWRRRHSRCPFAREAGSDRCAIARSGHSANGRAA